LTVRLAVSAGDPAGIGSEVILGALQEEVPGAYILVFGARAVFERLSESLGLKITFEIVDVAADLAVDSVSAGVPSAVGAEIQKRAFEQALDAVDRGACDAIVTAPWTKSLMPLIGIGPTGHTELLAERYGAPDHVMMLAGPRLRVSLVTTHIPLKSVSDAISESRIVEVTRTTVHDLKRFFGKENPKIAVLGLNPHAGESGHMGDEEIRVIGPAILRLKVEFAGQAQIEGPFPADTLFSKFAGDRTPFDAVICMYHDQGLIPLKAIHFGEAINITLGLPILRTSVDHGSAYDIAWQGQADAGSMRYALESAVECARWRSSYAR